MFAIVAGILLALAVLGLVRSSQGVLTPLFVGVLFALALDPVVGVLQHRLHRSRGIATLLIAVVLAVFLGVVVLLLGPKAVEQGSSFADDLPATIEEFYSWPVIGDRLEAWDAIGRADEFVADLPNRVDTDAISSFAEQAFGAIGAALLVLITTVAVLLDGPAIVRRARRIVPPARRSEPMRSVASCTGRSLGTSPVRSPWRS